jgi:hypothetical protein
LHSTFHNDAGDVDHPSLDDALLTLSIDCVYDRHGSNGHPPIVLLLARQVLVSLASVIARGQASSTHGENGGYDATSHDVLSNMSDAAYGTLRVTA